MNKKHRKILSELMNYCNSLGSQLDGTATSTRKYIDRQEALMQVSHVLFGVLADHEHNDYRDEDIEKALSALKEIELLARKTYPDKNGYLKPGETLI